MSKIFNKRWLALCLTVFALLPVWAEDIDLFVGATPASAASAPNVLLIMDNTGNWSSPFNAQKTALVNTFNNFSGGNFNVGLMMFTESGKGNSGSDGGYIRAAIRPMNDVNKARYADLINSLDSNDDKANNGQSSRSMQEAYLYFAGLAPSAGNNKVKADYAGNQSSGTTLASQAVWSLPGNALSSRASTSYLPPSNASLTCGAKNYIIYISNGAAQDPTTPMRAANDALAALGGDTTEIPLNPTGSAQNPSDEWARFMKESSLGITVYTIDINKTTSGQGPGWTALLKSMAGVSGGRYFDVAGDSDQISNAISTILSEIQSVNSVFASVSLPVSANTQGTFLNQVFVGMFRPDSDALPRWAGNLKQYQMGYIGSGTDLKLLDAKGDSAVNRNSGFINECARSFWTPATTNTDWAAAPPWPNSMTFCPPPVGSSPTLFKYSDSPDGIIVEKGAQNYVLRQTTTARNIKTCVSTCSPTAPSASLVDFNSTNVTAALTGADSASEHSEIINWTVGFEPGGAKRLSAHGDVVHSRPVAVNFGSDASPNVVVFYGANDGVFRAVNGNQTTNLGNTGIAPGAELWSFVPPEFHRKLRRLSKNNETGRISVPGGPAGGAPKDYAMDGPITAFTGPVGGANKTFIYATMRRGGRAIYAFDATNTLSTPTSPILKWRIGCSTAADTDCTTGMAGIGQTWSSLKSFSTAGYGSGASPLLIMGGGYDNCEDSDPHTCTAASKGGHIYVIDANTGTLVRTFTTGLNRGIVADATIVRDATGNAIHAYTADLGGNVYRIDFGTDMAANNSTSWSLTRIAALGCASTSTCTANRKFMFAPSVVKIDGNYAIMLGSGDREKPLAHWTSAATTSNHFFMFVDKPTVSSAIYPGTADCGSAIICLNSLFPIAKDAANPTSSQLAEKKGWYLGLHPAEQVVTSSITIFGVVTFSTHQPTPASADSCTNSLGFTRVYNLRFGDAAPANGDVSRFARVTGDGLPPSPVGGMVRVNGRLVPFCIGCDKDSFLESKQSNSTSSVAQPKGRTYWYIQK